jgi:hypothetical protein
MRLVDVCEAINLTSENNNIRERTDEWQMANRKSHIKVVSRWENDLRDLEVNMWRRDELWKIAICLNGTSALRGTYHSSPKRFKLQ